MRMANRDGEGVGGVMRFWILRQVQEKSDHPLDLSLFSAAISDDRAFDLER